MTLLLGVVAVLLNAGWVQAALVYQVSSQPCDSALLEQARERVAAQFGEVHSRPWLGCVHEAAFGLDVAYGRTSFAPLLPAVVLLGPEGQNSDVAAHEWAHAELSERVGVLTRTYGLPTWFDEGLAMQLDLRSEYNEQALAQLLSQRREKVPDQVPRLSAISNPSAFFQSDADTGRLHYALARCVVSRWPAAGDPQRLEAWLSSQHWSRPLSDEAFLAAQRRCLGTGLD